MLVRALEACFIDGQRRRKDAEFDYVGEKLPPHLVPVTSKAVPALPESPKPVALSEMAAGEKPKSFVETVGKSKK